MNGTKRTHADAIQGLLNQGYSIVQATVEVAWAFDISPAAAHAAYTVEYNLSI